MLAAVTGTAICLEGAPVTLPISRRLLRFHIRHRRLQHDVDDRFVRRGAFCEAEMTGKQLPPIQRRPYGQSVAIPATPRRSPARPSLEMALALACDRPAVPNDRHVAQRPGFALVAVRGGVSSWALVTV